MELTCYEFESKIDYLKVSVNLSFLRIYVIIVKHIIVNNSFY